MLRIDFDVYTTNLQVQYFQMCATDKCVGVDKFNLIVFQLQMDQFVEMLQR